MINLKLLLMPIFCVLCIRKTGLINSCVADKTIKRFVSFKFFQLSYKITDGLKRCQI